MRPATIHLADMEKKLLPGLLVAALLLFSAAARAETQEVYYPSGVLKARIHARLLPGGEAVRHGGFMGFHPNGRRAVEGRYLDGQEVGVWIWWDDRGNVIRRVRKDGHFEELLFGREFNSPKTVFRNTAKRKISEGQLKFDRGHGAWTYFFHDGTPQAEGSFLSGIPEGRWTQLYQDGQIRSIDEYKLGIAHGLFMRGYPNGQEEVKGRMDQGLRAGPWRYWYRNGQKKSEGEFLNDREDGEWSYWSEKGVLQQRLIYRGGRLIASLPIPSKPGRRLTEVIPERMRQVITPPQVFDEDGSEIRQRD